MMVNIEVRPGEGGEDAKALCKVQAGIYVSFLESRVAAYRVAQIGAS